MASTITDRPTSSVVEVIDRWYGQDRYFEVRGDDA
jgi:hypothetical protein